MFSTSSFILPNLGGVLQPTTTLDQAVFAELDVLDTLVPLDSSKASGIDDICPRILKSCALALYQPLYHLFSLTLSQHKLPKEWRTHKIMPIP